MPEETEEVSATSLLCKFTCTSVTLNDDNDDEQSIVLTALYDQDLSGMDSAFSKYTPSGRLEAYITNPKVKGFIVKGKKYFITITEAE